MDGHLTISPGVTLTVCPGVWVETQGYGYSGDGTAGGDFLFRFDVLPGDATDSGNVVASDVSVLASAFGLFASGSGDRYSVFVDYDGSGTVVADDVERWSEAVDAVLELGITF